MDAQALRLAAMDLGAAAVHVGHVGHHAEGRGRAPQRESVLLPGAERVQPLPSPRV